MPVAITRRLFGASLAGTLGFARTARAQTRPPNVLFLMADSLRGDALGYMGHPVARTPTFDQLARTGVALTRCFSAAGGGNPSRVSALSGRYPRTHGVTSGDSGLSDPAILLPRVLAAQGYRTAMAGDFELPGVDAAKLFDQRWTLTEDYRAFLDEKFPDLDGDMFALARRSQGQGPIRWPIGATRLAAEDHPTAWIVDRAMEVAEGAKEGEPWFCLASFQDPPGAYISPFPWPDRYPAEQISLPRLPQERPTPPTAANRDSDYVGMGDEAVLADVRRAYFGGISYLDEQIGRLVRKLRSLGQLENTLIVLTAARGDMLGDLGRMGAEAPHDPATRVPCMMHYEAGFKITGGVGRVTDTTCIAPTILELAGVPLPEGFESPSAKQILTVVGAEWDEVACHQNGFASVRTPEGRLVEPREHPTWTPQLFDLAKDPGETTNLYGNPEAAELQQKLTERMRRWESAS